MQVSQVKKLIRLTGNTPLILPLILPLKTTPNTLEHTSPKQIGFCLHKLTVAELDLKLEL